MSDPVWWREQSRKAKSHAIASYCLARAHQIEDTKMASDIGAIDNEKMPKRHTAIDLLNAAQLAADQARSLAIERDDNVFKRAAETIAAKDAQIAALKEALAPFAVICAYYEGDRDNPPDDRKEFLVEMKHLRRARSAYDEGK